MGIKYTKESVEKLQGLLLTFTQHNAPLRRNLNDRLLYVDRCIQRTADRTPENIKAKLNQRLGKTKIANEEVPVCYSQLDSMVSWLVGVFLTGTPIIAATTRKQEKLEQVIMLNALSEQDQIEFQWLPQLLTCLKDSLKGSFVALEVSWEERSRVVLRNEAGKTKVDKVTFSGNNLKRLDPYNVLFDPTVPISKVNSDGVFIGYIEKMSATAARILENKLSKNADSLISRFRDARNVGMTSNLFDFPDIGFFGNPEALQGSSGTNWAVYLNLETTNKTGSKFQGINEVVTIYARLFLADLAIPATTSDPVIFKLVYINGWLRYACPLEDAHGEFPIILGTADDDGIGFQSNSLIEHLTSNQANLSSLVAGQLNAIRRAVADRALYDPNRIDPKYIDSQNPVAKIPVKSTALNKDLTTAYIPIAYQDSVSPYFQQNFSILSSFGQQITGVNQASQGNFVKGNKTKSEFQTVMTKADGRLQKVALCLEATLFGPLKTRLKYNYLQYAESTQVEVRSSSEKVDVNIQTIRESAIDFGMSDGMEAVSKMIDSDMLMTAITMLPQMPELNLEYSAAKMFVSLLKNTGLNLEEFKRTPEEQQQMMQQMQAQAAAAQAQPKPAGA